MSTSNRSPFEQCALASGLLTEPELDEARARVRWSGGDEPDTEGPPTEEQLADRLVDMGKLNVWQAKQLLEGRTKFNLGPYWIIDSIGQGGMGQVFKAEHSVTGRVVAVKVLPRSKTTPEAVVSFTNEIRALARLDHKKLVRALDEGYDGNVYYLVMEYVPGNDLRKLVRRDGPLSMEAAANIVSQVAEGLQHAHAQGLVHRDVKPANVLVTPNGEAKLSDLGLAGPLEEAAEKDPRFGKIVGTADYVSPDHVKSPWNPTSAWDIYSLGCTLYYAVTGKVPFPGGSTADKARAHCELRPLDPRRLNASLGTEFVDVMADMMAKDPAQRIQSAAEVMARLAPWVEKWQSTMAVGDGTPEKGKPPLPSVPSAIISRRVTPPPITRPPASVARRLQQYAAQVGDTETSFSDAPEHASDSEESSSLVLQTADSHPSTRWSNFGGNSDGQPADKANSALRWLVLLCVALAPLAAAGVVLVVWRLLRLLWP